MLDIPTRAATSRPHIPKDALKVLDAMIGTWLTGCQNGQDFLADASMPLPDAIAAVREMVRPNFAGHAQTRSILPHGFSLTIEPSFDLRQASRPLPGLPGGEAWP